MTNDNCPTNCVLCSIDELEDESEYPWEWDEEELED